MSEAVFGAVCLLGSEDVTSNSAYFSNGSLSLGCATQMLSRFMRLRSLNHPSLCSYVDFIQCRMAQNVVVLVSEHHHQTVWDYIQQKRVNAEWLNQVLFQFVDAVKYCHDNLLIVGLITPDDILLTDSHVPKIKLARYGLYEVGNGLVKQIIGSFWYLAPERLASLQQKKSTATYKSDVWTIGIILLSFFLRQRLEKIWGPKQILTVIYSLIKQANRQSILPFLLERIKNNATNVNVDIPSDYYSIISQCLEVLPSKRLSINELHEKLRLLNSSNLNENGLSNSNDSSKTDYTLNELFYLWNLCGQDVCNILVSRDVIKLRPPIQSLPLLVIDDFHQFGDGTSQLNTNLSVHILPHSNLNARLNELNKIAFRHSCEIPHGNQISLKYSTFHHQALIVKERDIDYQGLRMCTMRRFLRAFPFEKDRLKFEASKDIPPVYRGKVWAALLDVYQEDAVEDFANVDCMSEQISDRQLMVDIPRCHQYDELMITQAAHYKLKQILKSWLHSEKKYTYWQGLDSLAAPFLYLNFNNIPMAYSCFRKFIRRYLYGFFYRDNTIVIQEYLSVFMQLLAFVDAPLFCQLKALDFHPELFAIPWFLTSFAHVLPLQKLFHLWDSMLLADSSFPLFVGIAILCHLRNSLINAQFNDAILLFSDLPDVPIDNIVTAAWKLYNSVPNGCVARVHSSPFLRKKYKIVDGQRYKWDECPCPPIFLIDLKPLMKNESVLIIDLRPEFVHNKYPIPSSLSCSFELNQYSSKVFNQKVGNSIDQASKNQHVICLIDVPPYLSAKQAGIECVENGINLVCIYLDDFALLL